MTLKWICPVSPGATSVHFGNHRVWTSGKRMLWPCEVWTKTKKRCVICCFFRTVWETKLKLGEFFYFLVSVVSLFPHTVVVFSELYQLQHRCGFMDVWGTVGRRWRRETKWAELQRERERMKPEFISALLENTESGSREKVEGGLMAVVWEIN